jgi:hypothetical protein
MKTIKQISDEQLLISKYGDKRITTYDQVLRLVKSGSLKAGKFNKHQYFVTDAEIRNYNKRVEIYKKT